MADSIAAALYILPSWAAVGTAEMWGRRTAMEDRKRVIADEKHLYLLVCDGHSGVECADFVVERLLPRVRELENKHDDQTLIDIGIALDQEFLDVCKTDYGGSTATLAIIDAPGADGRTSRATVVSLGDTRAYHAQPRTPAQIERRRVGRIEIKRVKDEADRVYRAKLAEYRETRDRERRERIAAKKTQRAAERKQDGGEDGELSETEVDEPCDRSDWELDVTQELDADAEPSEDPDGLYDQHEVDAMKITQVTRDHKPDLPEEKKRIEAVPGFVTLWSNGSRMEKIGGPPGSDGSDGMALNMSRGYGDRIYKPREIKDARDRPLSCVADVVHLECVPGDKLIITTDGLDGFMYDNGRNLTHMFARGHDNDASSAFRRHYRWAAMQYPFAFGQRTRMSLDFASASNSSRHRDSKDRMPSSTDYGGDWPSAPWLWADSARYTAAYMCREAYRCGGTDNCAAIVVEFRPTPPQRCQFTTPPSEPERLFIPGLELQPEHDKILDAAIQEAAAAVVAGVGTKPQTKTEAETETKQRLGKAGKSGKTGKPGKAVIPGKAGKPEDAKAITGSMDEDVKRLHAKFAAMARLGGIVDGVVIDRLFEMFANGSTAIEADLRRRQRVAQLAEQLISTATPTELDAMERAIDGVVDRTSGRLDRELELALGSDHDEGEDLTYAIEACVSTVAPPTRKRKAAAALDGGDADAEAAARAGKRTKMVPES